MQPKGNPGVPMGGQNDREVFERVWRRVMPEEREGCPVTLNPPEPKQPQPGCGRSGSGPQRIMGGPPPMSNKQPMGQRPGINGQRPMPYSAEQVPPQPTSPPDSPEVVAEQNGGELTLRSPDQALGNDFPDLHDVPCLGSRAVGSVPLLQAMIAHEIQDARFYQTLSRRAGGNMARVFAAMASDEWRHGKRLSAAYFLISGVRYWPEPQGKVTLGSYLNALRQRFIEEQNGAAAYQAAAAECPDACLRELFLELAQEEGNHAEQIRAVVEQL